MACEPIDTMTMTPEEIEIQKKYQEVSLLEEKLTSVETDFANLCMEVSLFQQTYLEVMSPLYAVLDRWNLRIACTGLVIDRLRDVRDGLRPPPEDPFEWSASSIADAREEWTRRHQKTSTISDTNHESAPSERDQRTAKELYRELVKRFHPDLVTDPQAQQQRTDMMMEINEAYQQKDIATLETLLKRPAILDPKDEDSGDILVRLIRRVSQLEGLIQQTETRIAKEKETELMQLYLQCQQCAETYGDPFYIIKTAVHEQVARAKIEWMHQRARESKLWTEVEE